MHASRAFEPALYEDVQPIDQHNHPYYHFILNAWCENRWVMAATQWVKRNPYEAIDQLLIAACILSLLGCAFFPTASAAIISMFFFSTSWLLFKCFAPNANFWFNCLNAVLIAMALAAAPVTTMLGCLFAYGLLSAIDHYSRQPVNIYHERGGEVARRMANSADRDVIISALAMLGVDDDALESEPNAAPARHLRRPESKSAGPTGLTSALMFVGGANDAFDENAPQPQRNVPRRRG